MPEASGCTHIPKPSTWTAVSQLQPWGQGGVVWKEVGGLLLRCLSCFRASSSLVSLTRCLASLPRQLSEENANLQEYVEKEVEEKKRLSRTNEELLWKLQGGDSVSPVKSPPASSTSFYRCSSGNSSPAKARTVRR